MSQRERLKTIHISTLAIWDLGEGKGRISTYYPLKAFVDRGHEVWFLTSSKIQKAGKVDEISTIKLKTIIHPVRKKHWETITTYLHLPLFIFASIIQSLIISLNHKPDIIYAHTIYSALPAYVVAKITGTKYVLKLYGIVKAKFFLKKLLQYISLKWPADLYIITNDGTFGDKIVKEYKILSSKVCFWVNGISKNWANIPIGYELKRKLVPNDEELVLSVNRLVGWKQVDILIRAIPHVIKQYEKVRFVIVGDGDQRKNLEKLTKHLGVSDFVKFEGAITHSKTMDYINACDLFVSMNALSSICNPVLEAMTCGKTVMALNTGATGDLIRNGENGILVNVEQKDKLPEYIVAALKNDKLRKKIGKNAQNFILSGWPTWRQRTSSEVDLIEALCSRDHKKFIEIKEKVDAILDLRKFNKAMVNV